MYIICIDHFVKKFLSITQRIINIVVGLPIHSESRITRVYLSNTIHKFFMAYIYYIVI